MYVHPGLFFLFYLLLFFLNFVFVRFFFSFHLNIILMISAMPESLFSDYIS